RTIVPLLRRRESFSGTERFHLYDAIDGQGGLVEDVYAFSNRADAGPSLVLVHNRQAEVEVVIDRSVASRRPGVAGGGRPGRTRLSDDLELPPADDAVIRFRDPRTGWERLVTAGELRRGGLRVHLGPYEARVLDVEPVPRHERAGAPGTADGGPEADGPNAGRRPGGRSDRARPARGTDRGPAPRVAPPGAPPSTRPAGSARRRSTTPRNGPKPGGRQEP
ncbi:MAG TPA: hypothetical protein VET90_01430, partial [Candidatus Binatus sp.]|nr:hypothetical protein [Candidatus Binatus sp.]